MKPTVLISWPCVGGGRRENIFQGTDNHYNYVKISSNRKHWHQKRNLNKETVFWNIDINMQKWMKVQCSLLLISFFFFFVFLSDKEHEGEDEGQWVSAWWFFLGGQAFCYQLHIMNTYSISFFFLRSDRRRHLSLSSVCVLSDMLTKTWEETSTLSNNVRAFWSLSSNIVDDTRSTVAKDLTWALVIIPALSLAYLCNLGLNKALWNTICTNRHLKKLFSSIWVTFSHCKQ